MARVPIFALLAGIALAIPGCGKAPAPPAPQSQSAPPPSTPGEQSNTDAPLEDPGAEELARALLEEAGPLHHLVCLRYPFTEAGRVAAGRCVAQEASARAEFEREFQQARQSSENLRKEGRIADAIKVLQDFTAKTSKEPLQRRAEAEIALFENGARAAFNDGVVKARSKIVAGAFGEAAAILEAAAKGSTDEIREALAGDLATLGRMRRRAEDRRAREGSAAAEAAFRDRARRILVLARMRKFDEALAALDAALQDPALSPLRDLVNADRAAVAAAAAFWDAIQKNLKGRMNQDHSFLLVDGKPVRGVVKRVVENGFTLQIDSTVRETAFDTLHPDQLILLAFGRGGLGEGSGESYARAAMAFFLEGKDPLAKLHLATAEELGADVGLLEDAWRRGLLRAALGK